MRKCFLPLLIIVAACSSKVNTEADVNSDFTYLDFEPKGNVVTVSRKQYADKLYGFWLGQCIANWTGLVTEMDKIGNIGEIKTGSFYTRQDWGKADQPNIWSPGKPSDLSSTIDFVFRGENEVWGADDDTDIEYMYQHLMFTNKTSVLTPQQIQAGWLKHIKTEEENYLWVSNQKAFDLMLAGMLPPETGSEANNEHHAMIDAQLTTEIFGFFAPTRPDVALQLAHLPIRTTADESIASIPEFYVNMYALATVVADPLPMKEKINWMASEARKQMDDKSTPARMYDFVKSKYDAGLPWEQTRDSVYVRYQVNQQDEYSITSQNLYCNGCYAAGINYAAGLVSLFYGEGDIVETIKIGALAGWDSDNPTATWGGMLGFMLGKAGVEKAFNRTFSNQFNIHRTRQNFPSNGVDSFENMARTGVFIIDRLVQEQLGGGIDLEKNVWIIPSKSN
ncbi:MAG: ADP-ribosylglycohydrolase family protein [Cyclobacteriaceae bacterium]|nr:MAG: ADP-ribosylglycohydrolase family protein [Cyclobacteriaceae bacterium]